MISNFKFKISNSKQDGFAVSIITFFILIIMVSVGLSMSSLIFYRQKISTNSVKSSQSYYAAEAGIEDALLKLNNNPQFPAGSYNLTVGSALATTTVSAALGGARTVTGQGDVNGINKKVQVVYSIDGEDVSFNYGAQVGNGGLQMSNSSRIIGNVFSSGNIVGSGSATIDNDVVVSGNGHSISGMHVGGNVLAYSCSNSTIDGNLTYVTGGTNTCTVAGTVSTQSAEIPSQPMALLPAEIDGFKSDALAGGSTGSITLSGTQTMTLGPRKVTGNLTVSNSAILTLSGTVHVTGNITISNSAKIKLASDYSTASGVLVADGIISQSNSSMFEGSGQAGSYLLVLSTSTSNSAITVSNSASSAIIYTSAGGIQVSNSFSAKEVTGYRLNMSNSATIQYESGLANMFFSSGPGGGWEVTSWEEK